MVEYNKKTRRQEDKNKQYHIVGYRKQSRHWYWFQKSFLFQKKINSFIIRLVEYNTKPRTNITMGSDGTNKASKSYFLLCCTSLLFGLACFCLVLSQFLFFYPTGHVVKESILLESHEKFDSFLHWCHFSIAPNLFLLSQPGSMMFMWELTACLDIDRKAPPIVSSTITIEFHDQSQPNWYFEALSLTCKHHNHVSSPTKGGPRWNLISMHDKSNVHGRCEVIVRTDQSVVYRVAVHNLRQGKYRYKVNANHLLPEGMEKSTLELPWYEYHVTNGMEKEIKMEKVMTNFEIQNKIETKQTPETSSTTTTIYVIADVQSGASTFRLSLERIAAAKKEQGIAADALIHLGDAVQNVNHPKEWHAYLFGPLEQENHISQTIPMMFVRGNHDNDNWHGNRKLHPLSLYTTGIHYSDYMVGTEIYVVVLDSNMAEDATQLKWFKSKMISEKRKRAKFTIVVVHIAPFVEYWEPEAWNNRGEKHWGEAIRYKYVALFDQYSVDMVMSGHSHIYQRGNNAPKQNKKGKNGDITFVPRNTPYDIWGGRGFVHGDTTTTYVICGGGGAELETPITNHVVDYQFYKVTKFEFHYMRLRVKSCASSNLSRCRLEVEAINPQTESRIDFFTLYSH